MKEHIIFGPAMIPNKRIYRNPNSLVKEPHYVFFSADTIEKIRTKFHAKGYDNKVNLNHDGIQVENVTLIQSFILSESNRASLPNKFHNLPNGTWMIAYKIDNEEIWQQIKDKEINGFSVEGRFVYDLNRQV